MHWIIQDGLHEDGMRSLLETLERFGLPYSTHKVVPFIGELIPDPEIDGKAIAIGAYSMKLHAARKGWDPGVYDLTEDHIRHGFDVLGSSMLNHPCQVCRFEDAPAMAAMHYEGDFFLRPLSDSKHFSGKVYSHSELDGWHRSVMALEDYGASLTPDTLVQLSRIRKIYSEFRHWVVEGKIVTSSQYKIGSRVKYDDRVDSSVIGWAQGMVSLLETSKKIQIGGTSRFLRAYVIDTAEAPEGPRVVEMNTPNSAGLCAADVQKLVMYLEDAEK